MRNIGLTFLVGLPFGLFLGLMFCWMADERKNKVLSFLLACIIGSFLFGGLIAGEAAQDEHSYNHGICIVCGGKYTFSGASQHRTSHHYYYTCDECGHTIETKRLMN